MIMMTKLPSGYPMMTKLIAKNDPRYFSVTSDKEYDLGQSNGSSQVTLNVDEMPSHSHTLSTDGAHTHNYKIVRFDDNNWRESESLTAGTDNAILASSASATPVGASLVGFIVTVIIPVLLKVPSLTL